MKQLSKTEFFSLFSLVFGFIGLGLQIWMFSTADSQGLLLHGHISETLSFIALAIVAGVNYVFLKIVNPKGEYTLLFPESPIAAAGCLFAAVGLCMSAFNTPAQGTLLYLLYVLGIMSGIVLIIAGFRRLQGEQPNGLLYGVVTVYLIFRTLAFCQKWSAEVQIQTFFFPLLGSIFLLLTAYYRAELGADMGNCRRYLFFRHLALFCCLCSMAWGDWVFYLSSAAWVATDYCLPNFYGKYAV